MDIPFVVFSGAVGEDVAIGLLKDGAHDFILKSQLKRLPLAVDRELRDALTREEKRKADQGLRELNRLYQVLSKVNQSIVRLNTQNELFSAVLDILREVGGFSEAWILEKAPQGWQAWADNLDLGTQDFPGLQKALEALDQSGTTQIWQNFTLELAEGPWKHLMQQRGFNSGAFLSLGPQFMLGLFSQESGKFDAGERELLDQLKEDLSYALRSFSMQRTTQEAQGLLQLIFEQSPNAMALVTSDSQEIKMVNASFQRLFWRGGGGISPGDPLNKLFPENLKDSYGGLDPRELVTAAFQGQDTFAREIRIPRMSGGASWALLACLSLRDANSQVLGALVAAMDITSQKAIENALNAERERLFVTLKSIGEGVITTDPQGVILLLNDSAARILGRGMADLIGERVQNLAPFKDFIQIGSGFTDWLQALTQVPETWTLDQDGEKKLLEVGLSPLFNPQSEIQGAVWVLRDVTQRESLEAQVRRSDKLESLGLLAGGIAHDFNNLLTGVFGFIQLAKMQAGNPAKVTATLDNALGIFERIKDLTNQLLTFSKGGEMARAPADLGPLMKKTADFCLAGTNLKVTQDLAPDLWPSLVNQNQIGQVLQNLMINAHQAMPEGGAVVLKAWNQILEPDNPWGILPGKYVGLAVEDDGPGIPLEIQKKIFDPFFTTKPTGNGLGLSICYSIVQKHGGCLDLESTPGVGTRFFLYLPATQKTAQGGTQIPKKLFPEGLRVLLMDDEDYARDVGLSVLENLGIQATVVSEGDQAVETFKQAQEAGKPFNCVILDLTIRGGKGGVETLIALKVLDPGVRAVASSGYSSDRVIADPPAYGFLGALPKPYTINDMVQVLNQVFSH